MSFDPDSLQAIPGITAISLRGNIESDDHPKIIKFLEQNPQYAKNMKLNSFRIWCLLIGKPPIIEDLLDQLAEFGIKISTKLLTINSTTDTSLIIDDVKLRNVVDNPPDELKRFEMIFRNDMCSTLTIKSKFSSALLFRSGRVLFTTGRGKDHVTFQNEIICGISACNFVKKIDGDLSNSKQ